MIKVMERKKDTLNDELVNEMKKLRDDLNKLVMIIGQEEIKRKRIKQQLDSFDETLKQYYDLHSEFDSKLSMKLNELEKTYKNGEVDLDNGVIYYEEKT